MKDLKTIQLILNNEVKNEGLKPEIFEKVNGLISNVRAENIDLMRFLEVIRAVTDMNSELNNLIERQVLRYEEFGRFINEQSEDYKKTTMYDVMEQLYMINNKKLKKVRKYLKK